MEVFIGCFILLLFLLSILLVAMGLVELFQERDLKYLLVILVGILGTVACSGIMFS